MHSKSVCIKLLCMLPQSPLLLTATSNQYQFPTLSDTMSLWAMELVKMDTESQTFTQSILIEDPRH